MQNLNSWLHKANDDELNAQSILRHKDGTPSGVCFLSQQMAEKYLKAILLHNNKPLIKIHELDKLLELCLAHYSKLSSLEDDVIYLTDFYIDTRYPGDYDEFSWSEAEEAMHAAQRIKQLCLECISNA